MESTCGCDQEKLFLFIFEYQAVLSLAFLRFLHNGVSVASSNGAFLLQQIRQMRDLSPESLSFSSFPTFKTRLSLNILYLKKKKIQKILNTK